jgi:hypothetical protein
LRTSGRLNATRTVGCATPSPTPPVAPSPLAACAWAAAPLAGQCARAGYADGAGTNAKFNNLREITFSALGDAYVGDYNNHAVRKVEELCGSDPAFAEDVELLRRMLEG